MRFIAVLIFLLVLSACGDSNIKERSYFELLLDGEWILVSSDEKAPYFQNAVKYSEDKQVFHIDSQGYIIPPHHEELFELKGDTLTIVDYKYELRFIEEKGTSIFLIKKIDEDELVLETIFPEPNQLKFKKY